MKKLDVPKLLQQIADSTNQDAQVIGKVFKKQNTAKLFLQTSNFNKIKKDLNLPNNITEEEFSTQIINAK